MKSPYQIRQQLSKQWHNANHRIQRLIGGFDDGGNDKNNQPISAFPIKINIGKPTNKSIEQDIATVRKHFQAWQDFTKLNIATVTWENHSYRATNSVIYYPAYLIIDNVEQWQALLLADNDKQQLQKLLYLLNHQFVQAWQFAQPNIAYKQLSLLIRQLKLVSNYDIDTLVQVLFMANLLSPNCANGSPLRALTLEQIINSSANSSGMFTNYLPILANNLDSKFFEKHYKLLCLLLATRFENISNSKAGLESFLNADKTGVHWLLLAEFSPQQSSQQQPQQQPQRKWLPVKQMRMRDTDLAKAETVNSIPFDNILIIENEQCLHQLQAIENDGFLNTVAHSRFVHSNLLVILGAGNNLSWLANNVWQQKRLFYWGDIDSWGLAILSQARAWQPHITAIMMDKATLEQHKQHSVSEHNNYPYLPNHLTAEERELFLHLSSQQQRLEQEYVAVDWVAEKLAERFKEKLETS